MTEEPRSTKKAKTFRERAETELRDARGVLKGVPNEDPQSTAARHVQIATALAVLDLADAIRSNGGKVG